MRVFVLVVAGIFMGACSDDAAAPGLVQPDATTPLDLLTSAPSSAPDTTTTTDEDTTTESDSAVDTFVPPDIPPGENGASCVGDGDCTSGTCANGHCCTLGDGETACCAIDQDCAAFEGFDGRAVCTGVGPEGCKGNREVGKCNERFVCAAVIIDEPSACAGTPCSDGQCGAGGASVAGLCDFEGRCTVPEPVPCSDDDPCTRDRCAVDDGVVGCVSTPITGIADEACYDYPESTRGEGECRAGYILCAAGEAVGCFESQGPETERCDGRDEDCDGLTDDDTEPECYPYLCRGFFGCGIFCQDDDDCAAGNFCDGIQCVSTGEDGAPCEKDGECASDHCDNGYCCGNGVCCRETSDCAVLDALSCDSPSSCEGTRTTGVCSGDFSCDTVGEDDASACFGEVCAPPRCAGDLVLPVAYCGDAGQCEIGDGESCAPYACEDGVCLDECNGGGDCSALAECDDGECTGLPNGEACHDDDHCASDHCQNGFCCGNGMCCGQSSDCAELDLAPECDDAAACSGSQRVGVCGAAYRCELATVAADEACVGQRCGASECINLAGPQFVLEGLRERVCDGGGACTTADLDCRDDGDGCVGSSGIFAYDGCDPSRPACVDFSGQRCFD